MKKYDLLIVGNGFDLHTNYQTTYVSFLEYLKNNQPFKNKLLFFFYHAYDYRYFYNDEWTSFEQLLCQYLEFLNYIFTDSDVTFSSEECDFGTNTKYVSSFFIQNIQSLPINCLRILDISNPLAGFADFYWLDEFEKMHPLETRISSYQNANDALVIKIRHYFDILPSLDEVKQLVINYVNSLLIDSEKELAKYIKIATSEPLSKSKFIEDRIGDWVGKALSFNYSHTVKDMFSLKDYDIAYVHGDVDSQIVLGIEEDMIENQTIKESTKMFSIFFKRTRRFIKKCNSHFKNKILDNILPSSKIAIFGHSLDKSDKSIFNQIFERKFSSCDIYYFGEENNYRIKLIELIGIDKVEKLDNSGMLNFIPIE